MKKMYCPQRNGFLRAACRAHRHGMASRETRVKEIGSSAIHCCIASLCIRIMLTVLPKQLGRDPPRVGRAGFGRQCI